MTQLHHDTNNAPRLPSVKICRAAYESAGRTDLKADETDQCYDQLNRFTNLIEAASWGRTRTLHLLCEGHFLSSSGQ